MSGVKGRSGRKSMRNEEKRLRIIDKAWDLIEQQFNDANIRLREKVEIAKSIVTKDMPTQLEGDIPNQRNETHIHYPEGWKPKEERVGLTSETLPS